MGLETGTYVTDLVTTNPVSGDLRSVGDDHLRLLKTTVKNTFPNGDRAQYLPRGAAKTAAYVVLSTDMERNFTADATGAAFAFSLPALAAGNDGWAARFTKIDSSANAVTITGTINGETNFVIKKQWETVVLMWTGTAWIAFRPVVFRDGTMVLPVGTTATRPGTPQKGAFWYNDTTSALEYSDATNWFSLLTTLQGAQLAYGGILNGTIVESRAGNIATYALKTLAGADPSSADPVLLAFRDPTVGSGGYIFRRVTAALSIDISSGSTMGVPAINTAFKLWIVLFDDAGTIRFGVINTLSGFNVYPLGRFPIASSTIEGGAGAADSAWVFYTKTSAVAAKAYLPIAYASYESGLTALGAWASAPTWIQLFGRGVPLPGSFLNTALTAKTDTSTIATTAGTYIDITGMSVALEHVGASNIVQLDFGLCLVSNTANTSFFILALRGSTALTRADAASNRSRATMTIFANPTNQGPPSGAFSLIDPTPGAVGTVTYKLQMATERTENAFINRNNTDTDNNTNARSTSFIKATEIMV